MVVKGPGLREVEMVKPAGYEVQVLRLDDRKFELRCAYLKMVSVSIEE